MSFADRYLSNQKGFNPRIKAFPNKNLKYIVVVPCYKEPQIFDTILSLQKAALSFIPVEVIVVVNSSETETEEIIQYNAETQKILAAWGEKNSTGNFQLFVLNISNIPRKYAGVGYARKVGMDEAINRFNLLGRKDGVIISFDADSKCDDNFFLEIDFHYQQFPKTNGANVYFEHPLEGDEFNIEIYDAITKYELHLRYFVQALKFIGFPYAFHTVGSCFNVSAEAYVKQGGMNRRQGGEDFYFLHKIIPLGNFYDIKSTRVIPSPRASNRVPFGTGPVISKILESDNKNFETYQFESFLEIKYFLDYIPILYHALLNSENIYLEELPKGINLFLGQENLIEHLKEAFSNSSTEINFKKRLFRWFDAFKLIKCLNFLHDNYFKKGNVEIEAEKLLTRKNIKLGAYSPKQILNIYRKLDRGEI